MYAHFPCRQFEFKWLLTCQYVYTLVITSKILHIINALQYLYPSMISVILLPTLPKYIHNIFWFFKSKTQALCRHSSNCEPGHFQNVQSAFKCPLTRPYLSPPPSPKCFLHNSMLFFSGSWDEPSGNRSFTRKTWIFFWLKNQLHFQYSRKSIHFRRYWLF